MSKTSLFSNNPVKSKNLVEFKAGKMNMDDQNWVTADKRKGLVFIHQGTDGLTHFCWKDRISGVVEDDLIVFPEDTEFRKIKNANGNRVYVLKFKNSKKLFLWLQEPKADKDEIICKKVNDSLNSLPNQTSAGSRANVDSEVQELLTGLGAAGYSMSQNEIMTLLGMGAGSSSLGSDSESSSRVSSAKPSSKAQVIKAEPEIAQVAEAPIVLSNKLKINELRSALSSVKTGLSDKPVNVDLTDVINASSVLPLLDKSANMDRLAPLLPANDSDIDLMSHVRDNVHSPQMHAAVKSFGSALQSGELGPVVAQFGLGKDVNEAATTGSLKQFAKVLESSSKTSEGMEADNDQETAVDVKEDPTQEPMDQD